MTFMIVVSTQVDGVQHGVALQVPEGWLEDPTKAEPLMYGAMVSFQQHIAKEKIRLMVGQDINVSFEEI